MTFEINEVIKGEYTGGTITLSFYGGTFGDVTIAVSDMQIPKIGEHGIYFVESMERLQVHPLSGWSQGHFIMEPDSTGIERVMTNKKQPVIGLEEDITSTQQIVPNQAPIQPLSKGVARGITLAQEKNNQIGLRVDEFKKVLYEKIRGKQMIKLMSCLNKKIKNTTIAIGLLSLLVGCFVSPVNAYQLQGYRWPQPNTTFYVDIPGEGDLWNNSFETAMYEWSNATVFRYYIVRQTYSDPCDSSDSRNGVRFDSTICGDAWGTSTLAITSTRYTGSQILQTDIVFNSNESWSVYSTPWSSWPKA